VTTVAPAAEVTAPDAAAAGETDGVGLGELSVLVAITVVGVVGWVSLALAHAGRHDGVVATLLGVGLVAGLGLVGWHRYRPVLRVRWREIVPAAAVLAVGLVVFLPGFPYAYADKDPGIYVLHGHAIADTGDVAFVDPVLAEASPDLPGAERARLGRIPGLWADADDPTRVTPQFLYFLPALFATAIDVAGASAAFHVSPLLGALGLACLFCATRRALGVWVASIAVVLLVTNMLEVWQAKYPTTEITTQALLLGALLGLIIGVEQRWRPALAAAGVLWGLGFLIRPDGILLYVIAAAVLALAYAFDRLDWRAGWFVGGWVVTMPHAAYQAWWGPSRLYADMNGVPSLWRVIGFFVVVALGAVIARRLIVPPMTRWWSSRPASHRTWLIRGLGGFATVALGAFFVYCAYRDRFDRTMLGVGDRASRLYDEVNIDRLSWFVTGTAFVLIVVGLFVLLWKRPTRASPWLLIAPGLALLPVYLWVARVSPRLMWWGRRYVPSVLPAIFILVGVALGALLARKGRFAWLSWIVGAILLGYLVQFQIRESWPLRDHREMAGTAPFALSVADLTPPDPDDEGSVLIWDVREPGDVFHDPSRNLAASVWLLGDRPAAVLPEPLTEAVLDEYRLQFPDRTLYFVSRRAAVPDGVDPSGLQPAGQLRSTTPIWEETSEERPDEATSFTTELNLWRVLPTP
jgi:hypothetical protein